MALRDWIVDYEQVAKGLRGLQRRCLQIDR